MNYKNIITDVAKTLDPGLAINVTIVTDEDLGEAHFVVAVIDYRDNDLRFQKRVPFIVYNDGEVYMPYDWECFLPMTAVDIDHTKWVSVRDDSPLYIINGLPRVF